jgi:hypothetical protein
LARDDWMTYQSQQMVEGVLRQQGFSVQGCEGDGRVLVVWSASAYSGVESGSECY